MPQPEAQRGRETFQRAHSWSQDLNLGFRRNSWITFTHTSPFQGALGEGVEPQSGPGEQEMLP